jgi:hypothetical protein
LYSCLSIGTSVEECAVVLEAVSCALGRCRLGRCGSGRHTHVVRGPEFSITKARRDGGGSVLVDGARLLTACTGGGGDGGLGRGGGDGGRARRHSRHTVALVASETGATIVAG